MPIIKSARKKLRQDNAQSQLNEKTLRSVKEALKLARKTSNKKSLTSAFSVIDTAAKKRVIHKNKAARLKSQLAHLLSKSQSKAGRPLPEKMSTSAI